MIIMLEQYTVEIGYLAMLFGSIMSASIFIQTYKIWKRKSSADVSFFVWAIAIPGFIFWLLYGISLNSIPLIVSNIIAIIATLSVLVIWLYYK